MIILQPITPACVADFKATRLHGLQDIPTAFGSTYAKESQLSDTDWQRRAAQWNNDRGISYLAWDNDQACGIVAGIIQESDPAKAFLLSMWVAPTHRCRGLGKLLVTTVIEWMKQRQVVSLYLHVTCNNNSAIRFYEHLGFAKTGNTIPYPNDSALVEFEMVRMMTQ